MSQLNFLSVSWLSMCWSKHHRLLLSNCFPQTWRIKWKRKWDWKSPHKWERAWSSPSSGELHRLTDVASSYIQTWRFDHSGWNGILFLLLFETQQQHILIFSSMERTMLLVSNGKPALIRRFWWMQLCLMSLHLGEKKLKLINFGYFSNAWNLKRYCLPTPGS